MWLHVLPGRARARVPGLRHHPQRAERLAQHLAEWPGVTRVDVSAVTGTALILYDPAQVALADLAAYLFPQQRLVLAAGAEVAATVEAAPVAVSAAQPAAPVTWSTPPRRSAVARPTAAPQAPVPRTLALPAAYGLCAAEVRERRAQHGLNLLQEPPRPSFLRRLLDQYKDVMQLTLVAGAGISLVSGHRRDALTLAAVLLLNGIVGASQAGGASRSFAALRSLGEQPARVRRDGQEQTVAAAELVPGDLLLLEAGDRLPADAQVLTGVGLAVDESLRTGECAAVEKAAAESLYAGCAVVRGRAQAVVTATGMASTLGHVAELLASKERPAPLQRHMDGLGRSLAKLGLWVAAGATGVALLRGQGVMGALLSGVSLAISAVPEGLPTFVTLALAAGSRQMAARHGRFQNLAAVEAMGGVSVLCCDKTGTLTGGEMVVTEVALPDAQWHISGSGYVAEGEFSCGGTVAAPDRAVLRLLKVAARCNNARLGLDPHGALATYGDPTEVALLVAALKAGVRATGGEGDRLLELPFDAERRRMTVVYPEGAGAVACTKGAPETLLPHCTWAYVKGEIKRLDVRVRRRMEKAAAEMAARGLRVLAVACRPLLARAEAQEAERDLVLLGLVGLADAPRPEALATVARCQAAGVRVVMITGDHPATATAIARQVGIPVEPERVITGDQLTALSAAELAQAVRRLTVVARVTPEQKSQIVRALRQAGETVAMTGDGVNDAPAMRAADVGIAMGERGTEVTRATAGLVLDDDNLQTVVAAIEQGRATRGNVGRTARYLLSSNAAEVCLMGAALLLGLPLPLLPMQLLWMNLVGDGLPATALGAEPPEPGLMQQPPERTPAILQPTFRRRTLGYGLRMGLAATGLYAWALASGRPLPQARALAMVTLASGQIRQLFACRSRGRTPQVARAGKLAAGLTLAALYLPPLQNSLGLAPLGLGDLALATGTALALA